MLIKPVQRYVKRQVEREIFRVVLAQAGLDADQAQVRLHWGMPKTIETNVSDMLKATELKLIDRDEFRKNVIKVGWELQEKKAEAPTDEKGSARSST